MADKIFKHDELVTERFSCDCLWAGHILDVSVEEKRIITFNLFMAGRSPFRYRLKEVWNLLRGKNGQLADFILRMEDVPSLIKLLREGEL